jgi:hypothetical protein
MQVNRTFWKKVRTTFQAEMNTRYAELRDNGLFSQGGVLGLPATCWDATPRN